MDLKKFTIILSNYNQEKYIFETIDSILIQTYKHIELIISDDSSDIFEKSKIEKHIKTKRKDINLVFVINNKNIGTVKTFNKCFKKVTGEYITIIAADDKFHDKDVIKRYADFFNKNKSANIVTSITHLYDNNLKIFDREFPKSEEYNFFEMSPKNQNKNLFFGPVFAPGATAYKTQLIKDAGYYDEIYKLIEDWSFFLKITRLYNKVYFINKPSLIHRGGGLSESSKVRKKTYKEMIKDTKNIYKKEIFPYFKNLDRTEINRVMSRFKLFIVYNNIFNFSVFMEFAFQVLFNKYYRGIFIKSKINYIITFLISVLIIYLTLEITNKFMVAVLTIAIYKLTFWFVTKIFNGKNNYYNS